MTAHGMRAAPAGGLGQLEREKHDHAPAPFLLLWAPSVAVRLVRMCCHRARQPQQPTSHKPASRSCAACSPATTITAPAGSRRVRSTRSPGLPLSRWTRTRTAGQPRGVRGPGPRLRHLGRATGQGAAVRVAKRDAFRAWDRTGDGHLDETEMSVNGAHDFVIADEDGDGPLSPGSLLSAPEPRQDRKGAALTPGHACHDRDHARDDP